MIALARRGAGLEELRAFTPTWTDEHLRVRAEWLNTCDETAVAQSYRGFQTDDIHADLPGIQGKALFIVAGKGPLSPEAVGELFRIAPDMPVRTVAGAGHMIPMEDLDGFFAAFGNFLGRSLHG